MTTKKLNDTVYCVQLWNGAVIDTTGSGSICCEMSHILPNTDIRRNTLNDFQNHPDVIKIRNEMINGIEPSECNNCFSREKYGVYTLRNYLNDNYDLIYPDHNFKFPIHVENLEIRYGDLCQLQCIMCHPVRSKKIKSVFDFIKINNTFIAKKQKNFLFYNSNIDTTWVEEDAVFEKILNECQHLKRVFINGGEPLLAKTHNTFLKKLIEREYSKNILLIYSTNFLLITKEHLELWKEFKNVNISLSLDDLYDRNRFIRYPSNWDSIVAQLNFIKDNYEKYPMIKFESIWRTINTLNFYYSIEFLEFFKNNYPFLKIRMRAIQDPHFLNPKNIKRLIGEKLINYCNNNDFQYIVEDIKYLLIENEDNNLFLDSLSYFKTIGEKHNMDMTIIFKEYFNMLEENNIMIS